VGQPYGDILVMAALDIQQRRIRFLGWEPEVDFEELARIMVKAELAYPLL
jgi:hypothetical protein